MRTIHLLSLSVCLMAWLVCSGCSDSSQPVTQANGQTAVTLRLNWVPEPEFGGFYAAQEQGDYAKAGLDVTLEPGGAGSPVVQMIATGKVPLGIVSADEVVIARSRGAKVVAVYAVCQTCPQAIMTHAARHFTSLKDVFSSPGTIAMEPGLPYAKYLTQKYPPAAGAKIVPYTGGIAQYLNDKNYSQQCFIFSEPLAAKRQGADPQSFLVADSGYNPYTVVVATTDDFLADHPDIVRRFVKATREGWARYMKDPAVANDVMGKLNSAMDAQTFTEAAAALKPLVQDDFTQANGLGAMTVKRWAELGQQLVDLKIIESAPAPDSCFRILKPKA
jgi:NitT/TauT family transport system substrate-binding protein